MEKEHAILIYASSSFQQEEANETKELMEACDMIVEEVFIQNIKQVNFRTYIGSGKCAEIKSYIDEHKIQLVIFQQLLSPLQVRNLEEQLEVGILDRSELILEIFAKRARSKEAKMQVESARLKKLLPRLVGGNDNLGRQSGGRNKGIGETQLEIDRRRIKAKITELDRSLRDVSGIRMIQRKQRIRNQVPLVALVGYTNAGKSTLMNAVLAYIDKGEEYQVLEKDMLFATLDTSVRRITTKNMHPFLLSDTVGFVSKLPHELVDAFHSTLEEVCYADLLLQVVDVSSPHADMQMEVTKQTLHDIHADHIPILTVFNKADISQFDYPKLISDSLYISAGTKVGIDLLLSSIEQHLYPDNKRFTLFIPYEDGAIIPSLMAQSEVLSIEHLENGTAYIVNMSEKLLTNYGKYVKL